MTLNQIESKFTGDVTKHSRQIIIVLLYYQMKTMKFSLHTRNTFRITICFVKYKFIKYFV